MGLVSAADSMTARQEGPRCSHDSGSTPGWLKGAKEAAEGGWEGCNMEAGVLLDTLPESQTAGKAKRQDAWPPTTFTKVGRGDSDFCFPTAVAPVRASLASAFISAVSKINAYFYSTFQNRGYKVPQQAANENVQRQKAY